MREILFRGKRKDTNWWEIGYYSTYTTSDGVVHSFINGFEYEVYPETVGQYTGITDRNGKMIWENDIVEKNDINAVGWGRKRICTVSFDELGYWSITTTLGDGYFIGEFNNERLEVIGNIFDNPELIQSE